MRRSSVIGNLHNGKELQPKLPATMPTAPEFQQQPQKACMCCSELVLTLRQTSWSSAM
jgi:hypothetical protein